MKRLILLCSVVILTGCTNKTLETGYTYTPLGDSNTKRRGYYADPFSPESRAAQQERATDYEGHRQIPGQ